MTVATTLRGRPRVGRQWWLRDGKEAHRCVYEVNSGNRCKGHAVVKGHCIPHARKLRIIKVCLACGGEHAPDERHHPLGRGRT